MKNIDSLDDLGKFRHCALVPTMGALHEGHAALIRAAAASGKTVVVTVFVNPTQFGPTEDFSRYPRTIEADMALAASAGATAIFVPTAEAIYPQGPLGAAQEAAQLALPPAATTPKLEDAFRPGHFNGVCQVVARLFDLCAPAAAYFGEKDYQQLRVVTQMVEANQSRWRGLSIVPCATVREANGLAMSSRNRYLDSEQRLAALGVSRALRAAAGSRSSHAGEAAMRTTLVKHGLATQYAVIRSEHTLCAIEPGANSARALIAAMIGGVRLIDNAAVEIGATTSTSD